MGQRTMLNSGQLGDWHRGLGLTTTTGDGSADLKVNLQGQLSS